MNKSNDSEVISMPTDVMGTAKWTLNDEETAIMVGEDVNVKGAESYKVYIPNIMPMVEQGDATETPLALTGSCFINAGDCSVTVASTVQSANYITVPTADNQNFSRPIMRKGATMKIRAKGKSVDRLYVTNHSDETEYSKSKSVNKDYRKYLSDALGIGSE